MEVDVTTKNPRISNQGNEIVTLDEDEEETINQIKDSHSRRILS